MQQSNDNNTIEAKYNTLAVRKHRNKRRAQGFIQKSFWVKLENKEELTRIIKNLNKMKSLHPEAKIIIGFEL